MKKLEFDKKIYNKALTLCPVNIDGGYYPDDIIREYLELAQEPPKPVIEGWVNVYPDGIGRTFASIVDAKNTARTDGISTHHLRYNYSTGKIEDITEKL